MVPQPVVVVGDGDDPRARRVPDGYPPGANECGLDRRDDVLDGVLTGGRVGQVAQRQRLREPVGGDGGHGGHLSCWGSDTKKPPGEEPGASTRRTRLVLAL